MLSTKRRMLSGELIYTSDSGVPLGNFRKAMLIHGTDFYGRYEGIRENNNGEMDLILEDGVVINNVHPENFSFTPNVWARLSGRETVYCNKTLNGEIMDWQLLMNQISDKNSFYRVMDRLQRDKSNAEYRSKLDGEMGLAQKKIIDDSNVLSKVKKLFVSQPKDYYRPYMREQMLEGEEEEK